MLSRTLLKNNFFIKTARINPIQMLAARDFSSKIKVDNPVVDIDGDEMTKIIWKWIKDKVSLFPKYILCNLQTNMVDAIFIHYFNLI